MVFLVPGESYLVGDSDLLNMRLALAEARVAYEEGEVPVGAVIFHPEAGLIGKAHNQKETLRDATAHAEILALGQASAALEDWRLTGSVLYTTLEPCPMCAGALIQARVSRLVFGARDPKAGAVTSVVRLLEPGHHVENNVLVVVLFHGRKVQVGRKAPLSPDEHFPQAGPALECEPAQDFMLCQKLEQVGQDDFLLCDHHVAKAGLCPVALDLGTCQHASRLPLYGLSPRQTGTVVQLFFGHIDNELPRAPITDSAGLRFFWSEE